MGNFNKGDLILKKGSHIKKYLLIVLEGSLKAK